MPDLLVPFLATVAVLTLSPGPDMALVLRNGLVGGRHLAWVTALGCCTGIAAHAVAALLGLSALLAVSAAAFTVVTLAGAAYLAYLGARLLRSALRRPPGPVDDPAGRPAHVPTPRAAFRQGLLGNLLNPKIALLFLTLLPQFVAADEPRLRTTAVLAALFLAVAVLWWRAFSLAVGRLAPLLARPAVRRTVDGVSGAVLVGLAARVALQRL